MGVEQKLERAVRRAQANGRVPAVSVALRRDDRPLWTFQVGDAGPGKSLDANTQFRLASITKTFTMTLVMQCRDAGLLDLDDPIRDHLELPAGGHSTIRDLLSHRSGLQRELSSPKWAHANGPALESVLADFAAAEQVLPNNRRFHYSNLAFAALGHMAAAKRGGSWAEVVAEYVLRPAGLANITVEPRESAATGYLVDYYTDHARVEPQTHSGAASPAGQLWGTPTDVSRWAAFLSHPESVDPEGKILSADTLEEVRQPHIVRDEAQWNQSMGIGVMLENRGGRVYDVGHNGATFGYLACARGRYGSDIPPGLSVSTVGSSGTGSEVIALATELLDLSVAEDPVDIPVWTIGEPVPSEFASILGHWWSEGLGVDFHWKNGALCAHSQGDGEQTPPAVFVPEGGNLRTVAGREAGELLELERSADGTVTRMTWATYPVLRERDTPLLEG